MRRGSLRQFIDKSDSCPLNGRYTTRTSSKHGTQMDAEKVSLTLASYFRLQQWLLTLLTLRETSTCIPVDHSAAHLLLWNSDLAAPIVTPRICATWFMGETITKSTENIGTNFAGHKGHLVRHTTSDNKTKFRF